MAYKAINGLWRYKFLVDSEFVPGVTGGRILPNEDLVPVVFYVKEIDPWREHVLL
jgi:hypothetical protein